eukprot:SAG11_NODE_16_length_26235_cov_39.900417_11_plen_134_part_00
MVHASSALGNDLWVILSIVESAATAVDAAVRNRQLFGTVRNGQDRVRSRVQYGSIFLIHTQIAGNLPAIMPSNTNRRSAYRSMGCGAQRAAPACSSAAQAEPAAAAGVAIAAAGIGHGRRATSARRSILISQP